MGLNNINSKSTWGQAASDINTNFTTIDSELKKVKNATTRNKGYFSSIDELKAAFSTANVGDIAYVGSAYPYAIWKWNGSAWANSGSTGGEESVNLGNYYTKVETDEKFTETDEKLSELGSKLNNEFIFSSFHASAGNINYDYHVQVGDTLILTNTGNNNINAFTYGNNVVIETLARDLQPKSVIRFTATKESKILRISYFNDGGSFRITKESSVINRVDILEQNCGLYEDKPVELIPNKYIQTNYNVGESFDFSNIVSYNGYNYGTYKLRKDETVILTTTGNSTGTRGLCVIDSNSIVQLVTTGALNEYRYKATFDCTIAINSQSGYEVSIYRSPLYYAEEIEENRKEISDGLEKAEESVEKLRDAEFALSSSHQGSGNINYDYHVQVGDTLILTNTGNNNINAFTYGNNVVIETLARDLQPKSVIRFTATKESKILRISYFNDGGSFRITKESSVDFRVTDLEEKEGMYEDSQPVFFEKQYIQSNYNVGDRFDFGDVVNNDEYSYAMVNLKKGDTIILTTVGNLAGTRGLCIIDNNGIVQYLTPGNGVGLDEYQFKAMYDCTAAINSKSGYHIRIFREIRNLIEDNDYSIINAPYNDSEYIKTESAINEFLDHRNYTGHSGFVSGYVYLEKGEKLIITTSGNGSSSCSYCICTRKGYVIDKSQKAVANRIITANEDCIAIYNSNKSSFSFKLFVKNGNLAKYSRSNINDVNNFLGFQEAVINELLTNYIGIVPNFNLPHTKDMGFITTDVDNTVNSIDINNDTEVMRGKSPVFYFNGKKRGCMVLYDDNNEPFIFDAEGNKKYLSFKE